MLLIALLIFCEILSDIGPKSIQNDPNLSEDILQNFTKLEEDMKNGQFSISSEDNVSNEISDPADGTLPPLVPLEFPPNFIETHGKKIEEAVMVKMDKFLGASTTEQLKNMDSDEGIIEHISKMDFNNSVVNFIVRKCISNIKPKDSVPLEGITNKVECKRACRKNQITPIIFLQRIFHNFISKATDEDIRFRIYQDPKQRYEYKLDPEKNQYQCKCLNKGYNMKVSPRLLEIINTKYFNNPNGADLADELLKENVEEEISNKGSMFGLRKLGKLALYFTGYGGGGSKLRWYNNGYYRPRKDPMDFLLTHLLINVFLFFVCHCLWYFHIVYFVLAFFSEYVLH